MPNEAIVTVAGYIATEPSFSQNKGGSPMLRMRLAWTPRRFDRVSNQWQDQSTCFVWVKCWRRIAENANFCLSKGDAVVVSGTLTVTEYLSTKDGSRRTSVDITATSIGHDLSRGISSFRRQRQSDERTAQDSQSGPEAVGDIDAGGLEATDSHLSDPELSDPELADPELADPELRTSALPDEEEEPEPASAR
jgi:single-strand DNA-binding protein